VCARRPIKTVARLRGRQSIVTRCKSRPSAVPRTARRDAPSFRPGFALLEVMFFIILLSCAWVRSGRSRSQCGLAAHGGLDGQAGSCVAVPPGQRSIASLGMESGMLLMNLTVCLLGATDGRIRPDHSVVPKRSLDGDGYLSCCNCGHRDDGVIRRLIPSTLRLSSSPRVAPDDRGVDRPRADLPRWLAWRALDSGAILASCNAAMMWGFVIITARHLWVIYDSALRFANRRWQYSRTEDAKANGEVYGRHAWALGAQCCCAAIGRRDQPPSLRARSYTRRLTIHIPFRLRSNPRRSFYYA